MDRDLVATPPLAPATPTTNLHDLMMAQVRDLYAAEKDTVQVLTELARAASNPQLAYLFRLHGSETREHILRLKRVLDGQETRPTPLRNRGKRGLLEDCIELASDQTLEPSVRDAALIAVAQHLEHDEIASYESVCTWAGVLGLHEMAGQLALSMADERRAESRLKRLGESMQARPQRVHTTT